MKLRGKTRHQFQAGAPAVAAVRPDDIVVGADPATLNAFRAKVEIVEYLGREHEAILSLEAGGRLFLRTATPVTPGETVAVTFPPDRLIFLPAEGGAA